MPGTAPYWLLGGAALLSLLLPACTLFYGGLPQPTQDFVPSRHGSSDAASALPTRAVHARPRGGEHFDEGVLLEEQRALGPKLARRHVVEFTDFYCPHCQEAHAVTTEPLLRDWVQHGRVRLESHPVCFLDDDSMMAAHAALCAQEQHKYWEVRELLFQVEVTHEYNETVSRADRSDFGNTVFDGPVLRRLAELAGLDVQAFIRCHTSGRHVEEVHRITRVARGVGVRATPTFLINGERVEGPVAYDRLVEVLGPGGPVQEHELPAGLRKQRGATAAAA